MNARTIPMSALVRRMVHDAEGRAIGRIQDITAEMELHRDGNAYVVTHVTIGRYGRADAMENREIVSCPGERWRRWTGYRRYDVPWRWLDLSDPSRPRLRRPAREH
jgi:sporulation protein YlmC with PRC-barrel domain